MNTNSISSDTSPQYFVQPVNELATQQPVHQFNVNHISPVHQETFKRQEISPHTGSEASLTENVVNVVNEQPSSSQPVADVAKDAPHQQGRIDTASKLTDIANEMNGPDVVMAFRRNPQIVSVSYKLFDELSEQHLPLAFRKEVLTSTGRLMRKAIGIMCKDIKPEDKNKLTEVITILSRAKCDGSAEAKCLKGLNHLLLKYGRASFIKFAENYAEHCREAWRFLHPKHIGNVLETDVFWTRAERNYDGILGLIVDMTQPNAYWRTIESALDLFRDLTSGLSGCIKYNDETFVSPNIYSPTRTQYTARDRLIPDPIEIDIPVGPDGLFYFDISYDVRDCFISAKDLFTCYLC